MRVLCSDGLSRYLKDDDLIANLHENQQQFVDHLVDLAYRSGGAANITTIVIDVEEDQSNADERNVPFLAIGR